MENDPEDLSVPSELSDTPEGEYVRQLEGRRSWLRRGLWGAMGAAAGWAGYYYWAPNAVVPLHFDGLYAYAHASHPVAIHRIVALGNGLVDKPYKWGGGHQKLYDDGFDCSGSISHILFLSKLLDRPLNSADFVRYGVAGQGNYVTLYVKPGHHVFMVVCGLRFDTSGERPSEGPRWRLGGRSLDGFIPRHPANF